MTDGSGSFDCDDVWSGSVAGKDCVCGTCEISGTSVEDVAPGEKISVAEADEAIATLATSGAPVAGIVIP